VKLLLISEVFPPQMGGSGRWLWELYRRLPMDVDIAAGECAGADVFDRSHDARITRMPLVFSTWSLGHPRGAVQYLKTARAVRRLFRGARPDAIHCGKCLPDGLVGLAARLGTAIPVWTYVHGEELRLAATSRELRALTKHVLGASARVIANSQHTSRLVAADWNVPRERITVLHPGVDASKFTPAAPDAAVRARLGWTGRRVVLTVGALQKRKGQDMMIRALPAIREHVPDVLYAIAGEGWELAYLQDLVREMNVGDLVQFRKVVSEEELIQCYQQCDLFALPNRQVGWDFEGFGIVLLEAQACGRAVIAGRSGGTGEAMAVGRSGELVDCDAPEDLARTVVALLGDPGRRAEMGAHGRQLVVDRFDWPSLTREASDLFARGAGRGGSAA
jgi:phosphatidyl-myo-inositol dimannoside synthase